MGPELADSSGMLIMLLFGALIGSSDCRNRYAITDHTVIVTLPYVNESGRLQQLAFAIAIDVFMLILEFAASTLWSL